ncbi:hypothetical protein HMF8227_01261 [Saliniradius amylolyticus]|uniref:Solute-binding protein family 3/N-terminal domain-containing protein n=1 Tax=Saliniradius amylolyticus TaxID=2183582 RepID=A0A2S2E2C1_9ALTE|nr:transporter substrate-binding domain-containing protein [Saliniradius amylolyticus]AWL11739.1 hypothetical protein HMF8227_01261 [Saliniradius amylolyticus]
MSRWLLLIALWFHCEAGLAAAKVSITVFDNHEEFTRLSPAYGLSWTLLEQAARKAEIQFDKRSTVWLGAQRRVKAHKSDLAFGALYSEERAKWAYFSLPMATESSALYVPAHVNAGPIDYKDSIVGVSNGSIQHRYAQKKGFNQIYPARSAFDLFAALNGQRIDYALLSDAFVRVYCQSHEVDLCPKRVTESLIHTTVHFVTANDNRPMINVVKRLNQALLSMGDSPQVKALFERYGFSNDQYQQWLDLIQSSPKLNRP